MASILTHGINPLSIGYKYIITAQDATDNYVEFNFNMVGTRIIPNFTIVTSAGVYVPIVDLVITADTNGKVRIADGATQSLTATNIIYFVGTKDCSQFS